MAITRLEIDLKALRHNYTYVRSKIAEDVMMMGVVKAFGYGSDSIAIGLELENIGIDYLAVAYASEGIALREAGIKVPILVLHPQPDNFEKIIEYNLEPNLYSKRVCELFEAVLKSNNRTDYPIHLKFNTGLNRLGFNKVDIDWILNFLKENTCIKVTSLFSHIVASEDSNEKEFTLGQIQEFIEISGKIILEETNKLRPVARLKTVISQIHKIKAGENVGYNRAFTATSDTVVATLPIGHADGISRSLGNGNGYVTIDDKKAFIIGNVCMDMIMVDVTGLDCREGDDVAVFGERTNAEELSLAMKSISYELLTCVGRRVKRVVLR